MASGRNISFQAEVRSRLLLPAALAARPAAAQPSPARVPGGAPALPRLSNFSLAVRA